jgi:hypothetical protein
MAQTVRKDRRSEEEQQENARRTKKRRRRNMAEAGANGRARGSLNNAPP